MTSAVSQQKMVLKHFTMDRYYDGPEVTKESAEVAFRHSDKTLGGQATFGYTSGKPLETRISLTADELSAVESICIGAVKRAYASINS